LPLLRQIWRLKGQKRKISTTSIASELTACPSSLRGDPFSDFLSIWGVLYADENRRVEGEMERSIGQTAASGGLRLFRLRAPLTAADLLKMAGPRWLVLFS
jgi:hypothetical protein